MTERIWALTEPQYRFGIGPIVLRSPQVIEDVVFDGALWWHLDAEVANGTPAAHGGWVRRRIYVVDTAWRSGAR